MLPKSHPFFAYINHTLSMRVDEYSGDDDFRHRILDLQPTHPVEFIDRHLAPHLQLRSVRSDRDIPKLLANFIEREISAYFAKECTFDPSKGYEANGDEDLEHLTKGPSEKIAELYQYNFAHLSKFAGQFYLCPEKDCWQSMPIHRQSDTPEHDFVNVRALQLSHRWQGEDAKSSMLSPSMLTTLAELHDRGPLFAIWHFFPYNAIGENLVMGLKEYPHFPWQTSQTKGCDITSTDVPAHPPDSDKLVSRLLSCKGTLLSRPNIKTSSNSGKARRIVIPSGGCRTGKDARPYRTDHRHYIQRAWTQAVQNDATFLIFSCGRYDRIGIRHRQSQTLFLSEPIDCTTQRGIPYGKIQAGLQTAVIRDALDRHKLRRTLRADTGQKPSISKKRKTDGNNVDEADRSKRPRTHGATKIASGQMPATDVEIRDALCSTQLALVSLNFDFYRSSKPSAFIRRSSVPGIIPDESAKGVKQQSYPISETILIRLHEEVGSGSTGTVYRGTACMNPNTGFVSECPVIMKMVFHSRYCDITEPDYYQHVVNPKMRLENEYEIYQHLVKMGAMTSIPSVYGLFEDVESNTLALLMSDEGTSLYLRESLTTGVQYPQVITAISKTERERALAALKLIHQAGIYHRDIRAANIVVNDREEVVIIDFDLAEYSDDFSAQEREVKCLEHILDGLGDTDKFYPFRY